MSRICICVIKSIFDIQQDELKSQIIAKVNGYNYEYGVFFNTETDNNEPFMKNYNQHVFVFSFADNYYYNNCEMLLLPDQCSLNGQTNTVSFKSRTKIVADVMEMLVNKGLDVELFIGDSGTEYEDFDEYHINPSQIESVLSAANNRYDYLIAIHFFIHQTTTQPIR